MLRFTILSVNASTPSRGMELLAIDTIEDPEITTVAEAVWFHSGWLDGVGDQPPVGRIEQTPEGWWTFPGENFLRMYVQVDEL